MSKLSATGAVIYQAPPAYLKKDGRESLTAAELSHLVHEYHPAAPATLHAAMMTLVERFGASNVLRAAKVAAGDRDERAIEAAQREVLLGRGRR